MKILVHLISSSRATLYEAESSYQKGDLFCVAYIGEDGKKYVDKYPISNIFRVIEEYN